MPTQVPSRNGRGHAILSLSQWRAASSQAFGTLHISAPDEDSFQASVDVVEVGEVSLYDMTTPAHRVERTISDIQTGAPTWCKLSLQLDGTSSLTQDGRTLVLQPGTLALYLTSRPYVLSYEAPQHGLVVKFPRSFVHLSDEDLARVTATAITDTSGLGRVAVPLFEQLALNMRQLDSVHAIALVRSALDMRVSVFASTLPGPDPTVSSTHLLRQVKDYIAEHLGEENLGPRSIASALYISVRHLHSQFSLTGQSVGTYIRHQRLERIHDDLCRPELASRSIQEIGARWGLPDASHLSRVFKARYGITPSQLRRDGLRLSA